MANMKYGVLLVNVSDTDDYIYETIHTILGSAMETSDIQCELYNKDNIMGKIVYWSDECNVNVIIIINYHSSNVYVFEAIEETIANVHSKLARTISKMQETFKSMMPRIMCRVRNNTIIIYVPGSIKDTTNIYQKVVRITRSISYRIARKEGLSNMRFSLNNSAVESEIEIKRCKISSPDLFKDQTLVENKVRGEQEFPMVSVKTAVSIIRREIHIRVMYEENYEIVNLNDTNGRILHETTISKCNVPPFRTAAKHGYAVSANEGEGIRTVVKTTTSLEPETCVWVKTGAPVPDGATAVVQVRDTNRVLETTSNIDNNNETIDETKIRIMIKPEVNTNIKAIGSEISKGKVVVPMYTRIGPAEMGLLAATGYKEVKVTKRLTVGVLSIGDELQEPGIPLKSGHTYDSNRITLISLLKNKGFQPLDFGIVVDKTLPITYKIEQAIQEVDLLITTGSINDKDLLKSILRASFNADIHFGHVNVKPGKSTTFATCQFENKTKYFLCLPGNPISVLITAYLFLVPFVDEINNDYYAQPVMMSACLRQKYALHKRPRYVWTVLQWNENENFARAFNKGNLNTNKLLSCEGANALLMLPQQTGNEKEMPEAFVPAFLVNCPHKPNI